MREFLQEQQKVAEGREANLSRLQKYLEQKEEMITQSTPRINKKSAIFSPSSGDRIRRMSSARKLPTSSQPSIAKGRSRTPGLCKGHTVAPMLGTTIGARREEMAAKQAREAEERKRAQERIRGNRFVLQKVLRELEQACVDCNGNTSDPIKYSTLCNPGAHEIC